MIELKDFKVSPFGSPPTSGVYAINVRNMSYEKGENHTLYIGSSKNIRRRINNQSHPYKASFNRLPGIVFVSFYETDNFLELEKALIKKHKPILNKQLKYATS